MTRNKELLREILIQVHQAPAGQLLSQVLVSDELAGRIGSELSNKYVSDHVQQLIETGLVEGTVERTGIFIIRRLTSAGHDFIEDSSDPKVWSKTMELAGGKSLGIFREILVQVAAGVITSAVTR